MKILSLNCQRGYQPDLKAFLQETLRSGAYDFLLLQEFGKEVPSYVRDIPGYSLLRVYDTSVGEDSQTAIVHRVNHQPIAQSMLHFPKTCPDPVMGVRHSTFGSLCARFEFGARTVLMGSVHLHSGMDQSVRAAQMRHVKRQVLELRKDGDLVIFGGDCNFGYPGERRRAETIAAPEFACVTRRLGPTLDSRYSEKVPHLTNRVAAFFGVFGIRIPLWTDHLFVDAEIAEAVTCQVLPVRVSDHSPLELIT